MRPANIPRKRPVNWQFVRDCLRTRREMRAMQADGYRRHETDWEIIRGARWRERIVDAKVSACGKYVWTKIGPE